MDKIFGRRCNWRKTYFFTLLSLTRFRMRGGVGQKRPPSSFFSVFSKIWISPQNFLTFSLNPFATLTQSFKAIPSTSPKLLNLNRGHPIKKIKSLYKSSYDNCSDRVTKVDHMTHLQYNLSQNKFWVTR